jgi:hypothetical protein
MKSYSSEPRNTDIYEWYSPELPHGSSFKVFSAKTVDRAAPVLANAYTLAQNDRGKYFLIYASLGKVNSLEYSIKIAGLAQRGNVIEVRVSMNSPLKKDSIHGSRAYEPCDIIRVEKSELSVTGQLHFIFKNQYGSKLYETQFILK